MTGPRVVRQHGGLIIADEVQSGLGRSGNNMWAFMEYGLVPDIVTVGKGLGNGYPMGAVICSQVISDKLGGYFSTFGGNPVSCAIGEEIFCLTTHNISSFAAQDSASWTSSGMRNCRARPGWWGNIYRTN